MNRFLIALALLALVASCKKDQPCDDLDWGSAVGCESFDQDSSVNGYVTNYYPNSTAEHSEGSYVNGVQDGFWKFYYEDGTLWKEGHYVNGRVDGFWKLYFPSGEIQEEGSYQSCSRTGFWKFYYDDANNRPREEGSFDNGVKSGEWKYYNQDGELTGNESC